MARHEAQAALQHVALLQGGALQHIDASIQQIVNGVNNSMADSGIRPLGPGPGSNIMFEQHAAPIGPPGTGRPPTGPAPPSGGLLYADPHGGPSRTSSASTNSSLIFDPQGPPGRAGSTVPNTGLPAPSSLQLLGLLDSRSSAMAQAPMELVSHVLWV